MSRKELIHLSYLCGCSEVGNYPECSSKNVSYDEIRVDLVPKTSEFPRRKVIVDSSPNNKGREMGRLGGLVI